MILTKAALTALFIQCAPQVAPTTLETIVSVESSGNPNVIAVVQDGSSHYLETKEMAVKTAKELERQGLNYSVGLMQVNKKNFAKYGLNNDTAFDTCKNIEAGAKIYEECYVTASKSPEFPDEQSALRGALSCYYSGNLSRGFKKEGKVQLSYVDKADNAVNKIYSVPAIKPNGESGNASNPDASENNTTVTKEPKRQGWDVYGDFNL